MEVRVTNVGIPIGERSVSGFIAAPRMDWEMANGFLYLADIISDFYYYLQLTIKGKRPKRELKRVRLVLAPKSTLVETQSCYFKPMCELKSDKPDTWSVWVKKEGIIQSAWSNVSWLVLTTEGHPRWHSIIGENSIRGIKSLKTSEMTLKHIECNRVRDSRILVILAHTHDEGSLFYLLPLELVFLIIENIKADL